MSLAVFIEQNIERILDEWEVFARCIPIASGMAPDALRDHARGILKTIVLDLKSSQTLAQQTSKGQGHGRLIAAESQAEMHGTSRVAEGFSVTEAMAEFRALRASVLRIFAGRSRHAARQVIEITRFNEAIDQALSESLARYSDLKDSQSRLHEALLRASPDLHYVIDREGKLIYCNLAFAHLFGKRPEQLLGTELAMLSAPVTAEIARQMMHAAENGTTFCAELAFPTEQGGTRVFEQILVCVRDPQGQCEAIAATARDITERKASEESARHRANVDALTELPNRSRFLEQLDHEVKHATRTGLVLALLFIDLDGFKEVNDHYGHAAGDQLLQQVARRLESCVRDTDTVARLGGDEFTLILTDVTLPTYIETLTKEVLSEMARPFALSEGEVHISASIGIALYPAHGNNPDDLLGNADKAMYEAKQSGRNRYAFFSALPPASLVRPGPDAFRRH